MKSLVLHEKGMAWLRKNPLALASCIFLSLFLIGSVVFTFSIANSSTVVNKSAGIIIGVFCVLFFFCVSWLPTILKLIHPATFEFQSGEDRLIIRKNDKERVSVEWSRIKRINFVKRGKDVVMGVVFSFLNEEGKMRNFPLSLSYVPQEDLEKLVQFLYEVTSQGTPTGNRE